MAKAEFSVKFPCGLEIYFKVKALFLGEYFNLEDVKECPLHGKKCKKGDKK